MNAKKTLVVIASVLVGLLIGGWLLRVVIAALSIAFKVIIFVAIIAAMIWLGLQLIKKLES